MYVGLFLLIFIYFYSFIPTSWHLFIKWTFTEEYHGC